MRYYLTQQLITINSRPFQIYHLNFHSNHEMVTISLHFIEWYITQKRNVNKLPQQVGGTRSISGLVLYLGQWFS